MKTTYSSKILLAGEYTVLHDSDALAIPYTFYSGAWRAGIRSNYPFDFDGWIEHLSELKSKDIHLDVTRMEEELSNDIRFVSNIPQGGGLGSSGAITAAFYDRYVYSQNSIDSDLEEIRQILAHMESYFHGESSGVDPLVSLTGRGYIIKQGEGSLIECHIPQSLSLHLILTSTDRQTAPLIQFFQESMSKAKFAKKVHEIQIPTVADFVSAWSAGEVSRVEAALHTISQVEWDLCGPMITKEIKPFWKASLDSDSFCIKLCGAGGGGAYLACGMLPEDLPFKVLSIK